MSLLVYIAHNGHRLETDASAFKSVEELQEWIAQQSAVSLARQVLMTSRGKIVKYQALFAEQEIFVYDRHLFTNTNRRLSGADLSSIPIPDTLQVPNPPDTLLDESSLEAWQDLFQQRRTWSRQISEQAALLRKDVLRYDEEIANILRATAIAAERVRGNSGGLESGITEAQKWCKNVTHEPNLVLQNWDKTLRRMSSVKTKPELLHYFRAPGDSEDSHNSGDRTLFGLVSKPDANRAASRGKQAIKWLESQLADIERGFRSLLHDGGALVNDLKNQTVGLVGYSKHTVEDLTEEIETIADKIEKDCQNVLGPEEGPRSIASVSKIALLHTRNLLPSLLEAAGDLSQLLRKTVQQRNESGALAVRHLQRVSSVESTFAELKASVTNLEISDDDDRLALDTLTFIYQLPYIYGSTLIEVVRRNEWVDKMKQDTSTLADEMYVYKNEEERRRKKWSKQLEHYLSPQATGSNMIGIEVTLADAETTDQHSKRVDIEAYFTQLENLGDCDDALHRLRDSFKALDSPSKQQTKRANAFKHGSIHESAYGRNSLLLRGDDELISTLQTEKSRLEDRLKGSESRIRKLEDLLHRQSQISRPTLDSSRSALEHRPSSPRLTHVSLSPRAEPIPFRPSVSSSRRVSQNHSTEEKALVQRVLQLESDLEAERTKTTQAEQAAANQKQTHDGLLQQVQEAASTKRDLMDNFEAQQTEFDGERRLLLTENRSLKLKIDELEEELDRLSGSHDQKGMLTERNQALESEIEGLRKDAAAEFETLQGHIKDLQKEQRERHEVLEANDNRYKDEKKEWEARTESVQEQLHTMTKQRDAHLASLRSLHSLMLGTTSMSNDLSELISALEQAAKKSANDLQDLRSAVETAKVEHDSLQAQIESNKEVVQALQQRINNGETSTQALQENLYGQQMQFKSLENVLEEERAELTRLRAQLVDDESGPEALRSRIVDEERKVQTLSNDIASAQSHSQRLERLLRDRATRAEEISQLLFRQTDGLTRLLEHVGFSITRHEDGMVIQKMPKPTKDSVLIGTSQSIERAPSGPMPTTPAAEPPTYIHWALASEEDDEKEQFNAFAHESKDFDLEAFCEAMVKRIKDTEHIARKWQREAKNYRDRFHKAQFDSQHKIAFRGFREGDLALFLPTRNQAPKRSWAAFNVGAPHYFLREHETHRLKARDWLLARISKVEERVVDLSKKSNSQTASGHLLPPGVEAESEEENPFGLSDGLRWYYLDAAEERVGAPSTPGMGKSTVASAQVDAAGSIPRKEKPDDSAVTRTLAKSLDSRRSSGNSRKSILGASGVATPFAAGDASGAGSNLKDVEHADGAEGQGEGGDDSGQHAEPPDEQQEQNEPSAHEPDNGTQPPSNGLGGSAVDSRPKSPLKSRPWDALWSLDLNLEGKGGRS